MPFSSVSGPRAWAVLLGAVPVAAMAQSPASDSSPTQLPPVEVRERAETPRLAQPAAAASRLGLTVRETPASIDVVPREMLAERGSRTVSEAAQAAVGVLAGDFFLRSRLRSPCAASPTARSTPSTTASR